MPAALCPHGFAPAACLICRTLGMDGPVAVTTKGNVTAVPSTVATSAPRLAAAGGARRSLWPRVVGGVGAVALGGVALWWVLTLIVAVLHLLELVATAVVCGYAGWRLGVHHGRRHPR